MTGEGMTMKKAVLAIDTGGSKTAIRLLGLSGESIAGATIPGLARPVDDADAPLPELTECLKKLASRAEVVSVCVNLGGKNTEQFRRVLTGAFPGARVSIFRESSGVVADVIRENAGADALVLAGTGAIVISNGPKGHMISDGWGANIGDNGSGFWIGQQAIRRTLLALDGEAALTPMQMELSGRDCPLSPGEDLMTARDEARASFGFPLDRAGTAALCKLVYRHAQNNDECAKQILNDAGVCLAGSAVRGLKKSGCSGKVRVMVIGGVVKTSEFWKSSFEETIRTAYPDSETVIVDTNLLDGAAAYLMNEQKEPV